MGVLYTRDRQWHKRRVPDIWIVGISGPEGGKGIFWGGFADHGTFGSEDSDVIEFRCEIALWLSGESVGYSCCLMSGQVTPDAADKMRRTREGKGKWIVCFILFYLVLIGGCIE